MGTRNLKIGAASSTGIPVEVTQKAGIVRRCSTHFIYFLHKFHGLGKITLRHCCNTPYIACPGAMTDQVESGKSVKVQLLASYFPSYSAIRHRTTEVFSVHQTMFADVFDDAKKN